MDLVQLKFVNFSEKLIFQMILLLALPLAGSSFTLLWPNILPEGIILKSYSRDSRASDWGMSKPNYLPYVQERNNASRT